MSKKGGMKRKDEDIRKCFKPVLDDDDMKYYYYYNKGIVIETFDFVEFQLLEVIDEWKIDERWHLKTIHERTVRKFLRAFGEDVREG